MKESRSNITTKVPFFFFFLFCSHHHCRCRSHLSLQQFCKASHPRAIQRLIFGEDDEHKQKKMCMRMADVENACTLYTHSLRLCSLSRAAPIGNNKNICEMEDGAMAATAVTATTTTKNKTATTRTSV